MNENSTKICLDGKWKLFYEENCKCSKSASNLTDIVSLNKSGYRCITGTVPGNFELDMMDCGLLPDLFFGTNALMARKLENLHLWYATEFDVEDTDGEWYFDFEGIDTFAEIYLNGEEIGYTENMYIAHEFEATGLKLGKNQLVVHIIPSFLKSRENTMGAGILFHQPYNADSVTIRKAPHMFGWDIMPRILSGGMWRSVYLYKKSADRIDDIYLSCFKADKSQGSFHFYYKTAVSRDFMEGYKLRINGKCKDSTFTTERPLWHTEGRTFIHIDNPYIWWPKGMGDANLYEIKIDLYYYDELLDSKTVNVGVRTTRLEKTDYIENGEGEFCFYVNGEKMFVRGTNWVPMDAFHSRDKSRMPKALELLDGTNCNMVRCWGGNVYEDHEFFDFCDSHGIAVWQDFAMACSHYPQTDDFAHTLYSEAEAVVRKLRNHPSIFLWAGDNECDITMAGWHPYGVDPNKNILTRKVLPEVVRTNDPFRTFLPSSPYISERAYAEGKRALIPENHLWGPRKYYKADFYSKAVCRFASETGYHGCPEPESLRKFLSADKLWPWQDNDEWQIHASCMETRKGAMYSTRIPLMANQITELFGIQCNNINDFYIASQITQSEANKYFIERFRLGKWDSNTGILWWNLIDGWPQFSDSVVDYYYKKKIAYDVITNAQQTVSLLMREPDGDTLTLAATNDSLCEQKFTYKVYDAKDDTVLLSGEGTIGANITADIASLGCDTQKTTFYIIEWQIGDKVYKNHYLCGNAPVSYDVCLNGYKKLGYIK